MKTNYGKELNNLLSNLIVFVDDEITIMENTVARLEKHTKAKILNVYDDGEHWRGIAAPEFIQIVDSLRKLIEQSNPASEMSC